MKNNLTFRNLVNGLNEKDYKLLKLVMRMVKNHHSNKFSMAFNNVHTKDDLLNIIWNINGHQTSFSDSLLQTLLRNYKHHYIKSGVKFVDKNNQEYKLYSKILAKKRV